MFRQAGMAGLLALLMVLPAEHLLAAFCPMSIEARQQADCCPYATRDSGSTDEADTANSDHGESGTAHCDHSEFTSCNDCVCALVPYSGAEGSTVRDAMVTQSLADVPVASRSISYILSETIEVLAPPGKPIDRPVPIYLSNQVFLN